MGNPSHNYSSGIYSAAEIRDIERLAAALPNPPALMEKAGLAAAEVARDGLLIHGRTRVLVLAGPGNNGGDAFVTARHLHTWGYGVTLVFPGEPANLPADASKMRDAWIAAGGAIATEIPSNEGWDAVVDGLFGIGLEGRAGRELTGEYLDLVNTVNALQLPVLALDIPSGLGSDTGTVRGAAVKAAMTITFIGLKPGLLIHHGPDHCGDVLVRDLDLDVSVLKKPRAWTLDLVRAHTLLPAPRLANSHKGMFGSIGVIGGTTGMVGAALLAGTAALKFGTGRVYLGLIAENAPSVDTARPELMMRPVQDLFELDHLNCLVAGPGLGIGSSASFWLNSALETDLPLVLDADALNLIATHSRTASLLQKREAPSILTPHPAEAARLLNSDISRIQNDRMTAAAVLAEKYDCCAVLKGAGSICAVPGGKRYINTSGNPGLSSAGTGDILSGMIGALLAQGLTPENALLLGVYVHGAAADALWNQNCGPVGMTASEIPDAARRLLNQWIYR